MNGRVCGSLLALTLLLLVGIVGPGFFFGSDTASAVFLFEPDAPTVVLPPLLDLYDGRLIPRFCAYGHLPAYFSGALFAPLLVPMKLWSGSIDYFYFVLAMRTAQLLMGVLTVVYVYRLGLLCLPPGLALAGAMIVLAMPEFCNWVVNIHPDIYQTAGIAAAVFYLTRYTQTARRGDYWASAICAGLAAAAKYYGLFLFPAAAWAAWVQTGGAGRAWKDRLLPTFRQCLVYGGLTVTVFALFNVRILLFDESCRTWFTMIGAVPTTSGMLSELLSGKLANLCSPSLLGPLFLMVYVASGLCWLATVTGCSWGVGRANLGAVHVVVATFAAYYLGVHCDAFNIYHGERYALPFFCLLPVPVLALLYQLSGVRRLRPLGWLLAAVVAVTTVLRVCGAPVDTYCPLPAVIDIRLYRTVYYAASDADKELLTAAYCSAEDSARARLKSPLHAEQAWQLRKFWRDRSFLVSMPTTAGHRLTFPYRKESFAIFQARAWVIAHVAKDAVIYADPGLNLLPTTYENVGYSDNRDLPTRNVHVGGIEPEQIVKLRPDYILTTHRHVAEHIVADDPRYELAEGVPGRGAVYVLRRITQPWSSAGGPGSVRIADRTLPLAEFTPAEVDSGQVDSVSARNGGVWARGWAVDHQAGLPALAVIVVLEGRILAQGTVAGPRGDVAQHFQQAKFEPCGWELFVPAERLPAGKRTVRFYAVLRDERRLGTLLAAGDVRQEVVELPKK